MDTSVNDILFFSVFSILHFSLFCKYLFNIQMNTIKAHVKCIIVHVYLQLSLVLVNYSGLVGCCTK